MPTHDREDLNVHFITKIKSFASKFEDIMKFKSDENFAHEFAKFCESLKTNPDKKTAKDNNNQLITCFKLF